MAKRGVEWARREDERVRWSDPNFLAFWGVHVAALSVFFVPFSWDLVVVLAVTYAMRMFGITAGYHRYFAHRGFKTSRTFQFVLAWLGLMASQKGPLWWSGLHRHHHKYSDTPNDIHSPKRGFWWSHQTWFLVPKYDATPPSQLREFAAFPELLFIDRHWHVGPVFLGALLLLLGGLPWLFWGFFLSTTLTYHATFTINSLAHVWGSRRYETSDTSRNNPFLAVITFGEGWHNNHHFYQSTANNGFFWWEVDFTYWALRALSFLRIVRDLRTPPAWVLAGRPRRHSEATVAETRQALRLPDGLVQAMAAVARFRVELADALRSEQPQRKTFGSVNTTESVSSSEPVKTSDVAKVSEPAEDREAERDESATRGAILAAPSASGADAEVAVEQVRVMLAKAAVEAAERAKDAASEAAESARRYAFEIRDRLKAMSSADVARAAADLASDAAAAAAEMAEAMKTKVGEAWAEAARSAARAAEDAARRAAEATRGAESPASA